MTVGVRPRQGGQPEGQDREQAARGLRGARQDVLVAAPLGFTQPRIPVEHLAPLDQDRIPRVTAGDLAALSSTAGVVVPNRLDPHFLWPAPRPVMVTNH